VVTQTPRAPTSAASRAWSFTFRSDCGRCIQSALYVWIAGQDTTSKPFCRSLADVSLGPEK